jgi:hypothetical protein
MRDVAAHLGRLQPVLPVDHEEAAGSIRRDTVSGAHNRQSQLPAICRISPVSALR